MSPFPLDDLRLAADRIGRPVQDEGGGGSSCELAIDIDVFGVQHVGDADHAGVRKRHLIDAPLDRGMAVRIDNSGQDVLSGRLDDLSARRGGHLRVRSDRGDSGPADQNRAVLDRRVRDGQNGGVVNENHVLSARKSRDQKHRQHHQSDGASIDGLCRVQTFVMKSEREPWASDAHRDLLPLNGKVPPVPETVPAMEPPLKVPRKAQSPASACSRAEMVNSTTDPSNRPP